MSGPIVAVRLPAWLAGRVYLLERSPLRTRAHSLKGKVAECSRCLTNGAYFPFLYSDGWKVTGLPETASRVRTFPQKKIGYAPCIDTHTTCAWARAYGDMRTGTRHVQSARTRTGVASACGRHVTRRHSMQLPIKELTEDVCVAYKHERVLAQKHSIRIPYFCSIFSQRGVT